MERSQSALRSLCLVETPDSAVHSGIFVVNLFLAGCRHEEPLELLVENGKLMGLSLDLGGLITFLDKHFGKEDPIFFFWVHHPNTRLGGPFNFFASVPNTDLKIMNLVNNGKRRSKTVRTATKNMEGVLK